VPTTLTVSLNPAGLSPSTYEDTIVVQLAEEEATRIPVRFTVVPSGPAAQLVFTTQPASIVAGSTISPPVRVTAHDAFGNVATNFDGNVTIELHDNPESATLSGTTLSSASGGTAIFPDLGVDRAGTGYTLRATSDGFIAATSAPFNVSAGSVSIARSSISATPATISASNGSSASTITVTARDNAGNPVAGVPVTLSVTGGGNRLVPSSGTTNAAGVLTAALSATEVGAKTVSATLGGTRLPATPVVLVGPGAASQLTFEVQPSDSEEDELITPPVVVAARDAFGNLAVGLTGRVTISLTSGNSRLTGTREVSAVAGLATFVNLIITRDDDNYRLRATSPGLTSATSVTFDVDDD
jgi:hypothetical protein